MKFEENKISDYVTRCIFQPILNGVTKSTKNVRLLCSRLPWMFGWYLMINIRWSRNVTELVRDTRDTPTSTMSRTKGGTNDKDSCSSIGI